MDLNATGRAQVISQNRSTVRTRHELGLEQEGQSQIVAGDWGGYGRRPHDVWAEVVMLQAPNGSTKLELSKFHKPVDEQGPQAAPANQLGLRNIAFAVDDIHATVDRLKADSFELVGAIGVTRTPTGCATCGARRNHRLTGRAHHMTSQGLDVESRTY
jgi:hypothetical protein